MVCLCRAIRSQYVATLGSLSVNRSNKAQTSGSESASIALEPFVQSEAETDGGKG